MAAKKLKYDQNLDAKIIILSTTKWTVDQLIRECGYTVYVELGICDDGVTHVMQDMRSKEAVVFIRPRSSRSNS